MRASRSGVSLFLIELVIMLCVFVTAAAIDTLMLVRADNMARQSADLNRAVECAVSAAECYKKTGGGEAAGLTEDGGVWTAYYDKNWAPEAAAGAYALSMTVADGSARIEVTRGGEGLYGLTVKAAAYEK